MSQMAPGDTTVGSRPKTKGEARTNNKEKTPAKAEGDSWVKVEEEAARAKAEEAAHASAEQETQVKAEQEARAKAEEEAHARAEEEARARAEQEAQVKAEREAQVRAEQEAGVAAEQAARAKAEEEVRARVDQEAQVRAVKEELARAQQETRVESEIANFQEIGKEQLKSATASSTFFATGFQAITAETIEYSKKSLENGSAFVEKLLGAKSFQSAIYVRSEYAKTSYAALVAYLTKIGELNTKLATEAFKRRSHVA